MAVQCLAYAVEGGEPYGVYLAGLDVREVNVRDPDLLGQFVERHLPVSHDTVQSENDRHRSTSQGLVRLLLQPASVAEH